MTLRYWAVTDIDYAHQRTAKRIGIMIVILWILSFLVSVAPMFGWKDPEWHTRLENYECLVSQDIGYQIFATASSFYVPLLAILFLYWRIFLVARKRIRRRQQVNKRCFCFLYFSFSHFSFGLFSFPNVCLVFKCQKAQLQSMPPLLIYCSNVVAVALQTFLIKIYNFESFVFLTIIRSWRITKAQYFSCISITLKVAHFLRLSIKRVVPLFYFFVAIISFSHQEILYSRLWISTSPLHSIDCIFFLFSLERKSRGPTQQKKLYCRFAKFICFLVFNASWKWKNFHYRRLVKKLSHRTSLEKKKKKKNTNNGYMFVVVPERRRRNEMFKWFCLSFR